jgi:predicted transcriptional regulator of viral defense system
VLDRLPGRFTIGDIAKAADAGRKSSVYVRQVAVRWAKQGTTRRIGRGKYQKVQQGKPRAKARLQRKK